MAERPVVVVELAADAQHARDLSAGGLFVPGCALALNSECDLVVRSATDELWLHARVVFLDPQRGAGLELVGFGPEMKEQLHALISTAPTTQPFAYLDEDAARDRSELDDWLSEWTESPAAPDDRPAAFPGASDAAIALPDDPADEDPFSSLELELELEPEPDPGADGEGGEAEGADGDGEPGPDGTRRKVALNVHERLRHLTVSQQIKKAHTGELQERILLERLYGKTVWEALLRNPRLTAPEVARIARMASLPRPLIEIIVNNGAWLQIPEVRRALLGNRRLQNDQILRVLRLLPKHELKLAAVQTAYPHPVRDAAKKLLKDPL